MFLKQIFLTLIMNNISDTEARTVWCMLRTAQWLQTSVLSIQLNGSSTFSAHRPYLTDS